MDSHIDGLLESLERRFQNLDLLGAFYVLSPQAATHDEAVNVANLQLLASKFLNSHECCRNGPLSLFSVFCRLFMLR